MGARKDRRPRRPSHLPEAPPLVAINTRYHLSQGPSPAVLRFVNVAAGNSGNASRLTFRLIRLLLIFVIRIILVLSPPLLPAYASVLGDLCTLADPYSVADQGPSPNQDPICDVYISTDDTFLQ